MDEDKPFKPNFNNIKVVSESAASEPEPFVPRLKYDTCKYCLVCGGFFAEEGLGPYAGYIEELCSYCLTTPGINYSLKDGMGAKTMRELLLDHPDEERVREAFAQFHHNIPSELL